MDDNKVRYGRGLKESYLAIQEKDPNKVYFCTDVGEIFLGDVQFTSMAQLNDLKSRLSDAVGFVGDMDDLETDATTLVEAINNLVVASGGDYEPIVNKPKINGTELVGDKSFEDLGDVPLTNEEIRNIVDTQYTLIFG